jgi:hypothetical protein
MTLELPNENQLFMVLGEIKGKQDLMIESINQMQNTCLARRPACEARMAAIETFQAVRRHTMDEEDQVECIKAKTKPSWVYAVSMVGLLILGVVNLYMNVKGLGH